MTGVQTCALPIYWLDDLTSVVESFFPLIRTDTRSEIRIGAFVGKFWKDPVKYYDPFSPASLWVRWRAILTLNWGRVSFHRKQALFAQYIATQGWQRETAKVLRLGDAAHTDAEYRGRNSQSESEASETYPRWEMESTLFVLTHQWVDPAEETSGDVGQSPLEGLWRSMLQQDEDAFWESKEREDERQLDADRDERDAFEARAHLEEVAEKSLADAERKCNDRLEEMDAEQERRAYLEESSRPFRQ